MTKATLATETNPTKFWSRQLLLKTSFMTSKGTVHPFSHAVKESSYFKKTLERFSFDSTIPPLMFQDFFGYSRQSVKWNNKHFMTEPKGNSKFCFPETLSVSHGKADRHWGWKETKLTISCETRHSVLLYIYLITQN